MITATDLGSRMEYTVAAQVGEMLVSRPIHEARLTAGQDVALPITATDVSRVAKGPQMPGIRTRFDLACRLANDGGALALAYFQNRDTLVIEAKATPQDLVSGADREVEDLIRAAFPDDAILGEEGGATAGDSGFTWVIDPIDGTSAYLAGLPHWCVVIALLQGADTVAAVTSHPLGLEVFAAIKGQGAWVNGAPLRCNRDHRIDNSLIALGASHRTSPDHVAGGLAGSCHPGCGWRGRAGHRAAGVRAAECGG